MRFTRGMKVNYSQAQKQWCKKNIIKDKVHKISRHKFRKRNKKKQVRYMIRSPHNVSKETTSKYMQSYTISVSGKCNIILVKNVNALANSNSSIDTWSWRADLEIVTNHKCRVSNYPSRYPSTNTIKYGTTNFTFKHINEEKGIKTSLPGI
jgi:hypothetical protein